MNELTTLIFGMASGVIFSTMAVYILTMGFDWKLSKALIASLFAPILLPVGFVFLIVFSLSSGLRKCSSSFLKLGCVK